MLITRLQNKIRLIINKIDPLKNMRAFKYLIAGLWNTFFGYFTAVIIFYFFKSYLGVVGTGLVANILSISMSFFTYKFFVFKARGQWVSEYFRSFLVYGFNAILGIAFLYIGVSIFNFEFWLVQGVAVIFLAVVSYFSHANFTFRAK